MDEELLNNCALSAARSGWPEIISPQSPCLLFFLDVHSCEIHSAMLDEQDRPAPEPRGSGQGTAEQDEEVRATMELARQALEASAAETERGKRLRREIEREIEKRGDQPPADAGEKSGSDE